MLPNCLIFNPKYHLEPECFGQSGVHHPPTKNISSRLDQSSAAKHCWKNHLVVYKARCAVAGIKLFMSVIVKCHRCMVPFKRKLSFFQVFLNTVLTITIHMHIKRGFGGIRSRETCSGTSHASWFLLKHSTQVLETHKCQVHALFTNADKF